MHLGFSLNIPPELFSEILGFLDAKTLLLCSSVCKSWHTAVKSSPKLQYTIELWADGMIRGESGLLTSPENLAALYEYRRAWKSVQYKSKCTVASDLRSCRAYELVGGVFAQQQGPSFLAISLAKILDDPENAKISHDIETPDEHDFQDFAIDPTQDLMAFLFLAPGERARLHFRTILSHQPHPLAAIPCSLFTLDRNPRMTLSIQIVDDVIGIFILDPIGLVLYNWRTGTMLIEMFGKNLLPSVANFHFLSPRSYILGYKDNLFNGSGAIGIYIFEGNRPNSPTQIAALELPALNSDRYISSIQIQTGPFCANPIIGTPFSKSNDSRLFVFLMSYGPTRQWCRMFLHHRYLHRYVLDYVRENRTKTTVVPWEEWGPENSRILPAGNHSWNRHVHGERAAFPCPPNFLELLDFGVIPRRISTATEIPLSPDHLTTELHLEPSMLEGNNIFQKTVETSLPYSRTLCSLEEHDLFLIDQDRIIGVSFFETDDKQMTVYSL
ncbi:hypothetical protein B0H19DRAFT_1185045 [Mycena capillaripes]|nr:hypothetical protein B0H19DRAFT_1185045 [Mycena capillaripes]